MSLPENFIMKVCGLTEFTNLLEVRQTGVTHLGIIFAPSSPRKITLNAQLVKELKTNHQPGLCGVFVDADIQEVQEVAKAVSLSALQLSGTESPAYCRAIKQALPSIQLIKTLRPQTRHDFGEAKSFTDCVDVFSFETSHPSLAGGSGISFDWSILQGYADQTRFIISGGLGPENLGNALQVIAKHPSFVGVDLNSKVEKSIGIKNIVAIQECKRILAKHFGE